MMGLRSLLWPPGFTDPFDGPHRIAQPTKVVLIHGLGDTADVWRPLMQRLQLPTTAMAIDLPGHGQSPSLQQGRYVLKEMVKSAAETILEAGVDQPILIGHSLGARICASLALLPEISSIGTILIDVNSGEDCLVTQAVSEHLDAIMAGTTTLKELIQLYCNRIPLSDPETVSVFVTAMATFSQHRWRVPLNPKIKNLLSEKGNEDVYRMLSRTNKPVEIIRGAFSAVLTKDAAERLANLVPHRPVAVRVIEMAGHAILLEKPSDLAETLKTCIREMLLTS